MKRSVLLLSLAICALVAWVVWRVSNLRLVPLEPAHVERADLDGASSDDGTRTPASSADPRPDNPANSSASPSAPASPAASMATPSIARIRGRVVGGGAALAGARVWIAAQRGRWADGVEVPAIRVRGSTLRAFEAQSGSDGAFVIEAPPPMCASVRLEVETTDHRGKLAREIELRRTPMVAGENDLGELVVPLESALAGRVRLDSGAPVSGADVTVENASASGYLASCVSDPDGAFVLAGVPAGPLTLAANAPQLGVTKTVEVRLLPGEVREGIEIVLRTPLVLAGRVVDEQGVPIGDHALQGFVETEPGKHELYAAAHTDAEGNFTMKLRENVPHSLRGGGKEFARWDSRDTSTPVFAPGTSDIAVVLRRLPVATIVVLDASTREPIQDFRVRGVPRAGERDWDESWERAQLGGVAPYVGGRAQVAVAMSPQPVAVSARGYVERFASLRVLAEEVVLLERPAVLTGSLSRADEPARYAIVTARPLGEDAASPWSRQRANAPATNLPWRHPNGTHTTGAGVFRVDDLAPGAYELLAGAEGVETPQRIVRRFELRAGEVRDLGALELVKPTAALRVHLVDDPDWSTDWIRPQLRIHGRPALRAGAMSDAARSWSFESLPAGTCEIELWLDLGEAVTLATAELENGETRDVRIDPGASGLCTLNVLVAGAREGERLKIRIAEIGGNGKQHDTSWSRGYRRSPSFLLRGARSVRLSASEDTEDDEPARELVSTTVALPARGLVETTLRVR